MNVIDFSLYELKREKVNMFYYYWDKKQAKRSAN